MKLAAVNSNVGGIPLSGGYVDLSRAETGQIVSSASSLVKGVVGVGALALGAWFVLSLLGSGSAPLLGIDPRLEGNCIF